MGIESMSSDTHDHRASFQGPLMWACSLLAGAFLGWGLVQIAPANMPGHEGGDSHGSVAESGTIGHAEIASAGDELDGSTIGVIASNDAAEQAHEVASAGQVHGDESESDGSASHGNQSDAPDGDAQSHGTDNAASGSEGEDDHGGHGSAPEIPLWLVVPFAVLLGSIALMPFINERLWHHHFPDFAFFLGGTVLSYYLVGFGEGEYSHGMSYGLYQMKHVALEYIQFIALIGGLYVASGGILINVRGKGRPLVNTGLLGFGAVIANIVGTTGASVLLIRPFMRVNKGRLRPMHVVMFIFIVSNCGGALTPIGDPPLYLGFLKGVPFFWTLEHLWPMWATCVGLLLAVFYVMDRRIGPAPEGEGAGENGESFGISIKGMSGIIALALIIGAVFLDPLLQKSFPQLKGIPIGAMVQVAVATGAYFIANPAYHKANEFTFFPVKEVGLLFIGIFITMAPALGYLSAHGAELGLDSPTKFYFATGVLSGVLDNAPTYLNFLQVAISAAGYELNPEGIHAFIDHEPGIHELMAISLGAVFFGAMTYIGNGPNFMVRAIAESSGLKMPSFFGYVARALVVLLPVLLITWFIYFVLMSPTSIVG